MEAPQNANQNASQTAAGSARRSEDIALDLLKFVASVANVGGKSASGTGFGIPSAAKSDDQVQTLLDLYGRCREAVEAPIEK